MDDEVAELVTRYYNSLDDHDYETLESVLDPAFVQVRPDRSFEDRSSFVRFMREERPIPDTRHELDTLVTTPTAAAANGRVLDDDILFEFADFFSIEDNRITRLDTYTR